MCWRIATIYIMAHLSSIRADMDYMALLSETLRTRYLLGCTASSSATSVPLTLRCPPGTTISVTLAHYTDNPTASLGILEVPQCPLPVITPDQIFSLNCTSNVQTKWRDVDHGSWGRYSLLQTVVEACQKKRQCRVLTGDENERDPCLLHARLRRPRLVELAYKCRPYEFRSKLSCAGEKVSLSCNPGSRVAVYSGFYGRTEYENLHCPQPPGVPEETCVSEGGTRTVMRACHGRRSCVLTTSPKLFIRPATANPCKHSNTKPYLYVVYTCVPRKVLAEEYEMPLLPDEDEHLQEADVLEEGFDKADFKAAFSPSPNLVGPLSDTVNSTSRTPQPPPPLTKEGAGFGGSKDEGMFYVWVGLCSGVLLTLSAVLARVVVQQLNSGRPLTPDTPPRTKFPADLAAIEAEVDLTTTTLPITTKKSVPHVVEDTMTFNAAENRYPLRPISTTHRGLMETSLVTTNDLVEASLRNGQNLCCPA
ncbi:protein eva-1-like [Diprion similis]|uniref:protein eva-1-like n=1 Tax=Diprion similis TaxID=362088 RepID=UPI001EF7EA93|nr:protein eva-1-like [Diprion similis]